MPFIVTGGAVVAKVGSDTGEGYFYRDAILPEGVSAEECQRLVELGLVKELPEAKAQEKAGAPATAKR